MASKLVKFGFEISQIWLKSRPKDAKKIGGKNRKLRAQNIIIFFSKAPRPKSPVINIINVNVFHSGKLGPGIPLDKKSLEPKGGFRDPLSDPNFLGPAARKKIDVLLLEIVIYRV